MLYRIAGALILAVSGLLGAYSMNRAANAALAQVEGWISFLRELQGRVDCFSLPIPAFLAGCPPALLTACGYYGEGTPETLDELFAACGTDDDKTMTLVGNFCKEFGGGYRQSQLKLCEYYLDLLCRRRDELAAHLPMKKKMNATLCICAALAVVILLI